MLVYAYTVYLYSEMLLQQDLTKYLCQLVSQSISLFATLSTSINLKRIKNYSSLLIATMTMRENF